MFQGQWLSSGIGLVLTGLVFVLLVWIILRFAARLRPRLQTALVVPPQAEAPAHEDAILIVQVGGRIEHLNQQARAWFELQQDEQPNLESLARRVRPAEDFLLLCASERQARISISGRLTEGISYRLPGLSGDMLVSLRRPDLAHALDLSDEGVSTSVIKIVTDFSQTIAASLSLDTTIQTVLENVERLVPADALELKLWDETARQLVPYRFGAVQNNIRQVERAAATQFGDYAHKLINDRRPLLVADTQTYAEARLVENGDFSPIRSYLGIPLEAGGQLVGALEMGLNAADAFSRDDLSLLELITGQAAVALRNAVLYEEEQNRTAELSGLAKLAQAVGSLQDTRDLYTRLVESLASLFDVEILGFLIYNEASRAIEAQKPYHGIPEHVVEIFRAEIPVTSKAEELLLSQELYVTEKAFDDAIWLGLGLQMVALAASLRESALVPLVSGGRSLGFLHLSNHRSGKPSFSEDELRLMNIVANQAAAIIDNANLLQQSRQRAYRSEVLRQIASLASSSATLDELLIYSIRELGQMLQADNAAVFLMDDSQGILRLHAPSLWGIDAEAARPLSMLNADDPQFRFTVTSNRRAFISGKLQRDRRVLPIYRPIVESFNLSSCIVVPLMTRDRGLGEIMVGSDKENFFNDYDLQVLTTAAGQLAAAVEEAVIFAGTDEDLRSRVERMSETVRLSRELNASLDPNFQLEAAYKGLLRITGASCGSVLMMQAEEPDAPPVIRAYAGEAAGEELLLARKQALVQNEALVIEDFAAGEFESPHEGIASAAVVPVTYHDRPMGMILLHSKRAGAFTGELVDLAKTVAVQLAVALNNSLRYQDLLRRSELLRRQSGSTSQLIEITRGLSVDRSLDQTLNEMAHAIRKATPFDVVLISVYEAKTGLLRRVAGVGIPEDTLNELRARKQPLRSVQQLMKPEFKVGGAYFIPADQTPIVPADVHMVTLSDAVTDRPPEAWHSQDFLLFPLENADGDPLGLISLDSPRDGLRPDRVTIEAVEMFAVQTSLLIDSIYRTMALAEQVEILAATIDRQQRLLGTTQNNLPTLLRKDLEQTIAIHNLDRRAQRIRAGLQITESVSRQLDAASALQALGRELLTQLGMSVALVAEETADGPRLAHVLGNVPRATSPEALFGQRNPLRVCLQTGEIMLVMNLDEDDTWRETPLLSGLRAKSFICLPVIMNGKPLAAVLALSPEPMPALTAEDRQVYYQITRQASVILQNISLLSETRRRLQEVNLLLDFSRQLSGLDPESVVRSLLQSSRRVLSQTAHAGVVLLAEPGTDLLLPRAVSGYADNDRMKQIAYRVGEALPGQVFSDGHARSVEEVDFARDYNLSAENLLRYRQATGGRLPVSSLLIPIQAGERTLGVMVLDNFNAAGAFNTEDLTLLMSLTQQVALSLENIRLVQTSQERAGQLEALNQVATRLAASLRSDELIATLLSHLKSVIPYDTAILWVRSQNRLTVAAADGFTDTEERIGLTVDIEDSVLLKEMISTGQGISVPDVSEDPRFSMLAGSRYLSWMGTPLISKGEVAGVIALEKTEPHFYSRETVQVASTFASQAAVALENTRLFEESLQRAAELDQRSQRLAMLNRFSAALSESLNSDQVLRLTADELLRALNAAYVSIVTYDRGVPILRDQMPAPRRELPQNLAHAPIFEHLRDSQGIFVADDIAAEEALGALRKEFVDTQAMMILPILSGNDLRVLMFAHMDRVYHFSSSEIELARTLGNQAGIALENARLYQSTLSTAERLRILNQVSSEISASLDPETIYATVHWAVGQLMHVESFVIALLDEERQEIEGVYLMDYDRRSPSVRLPLGEGLSGRVIASGQPALITSADQINQMGGITYGERGMPRSIVAVPMTLGGKVVGMLSAQSYQPYVYTEADQQILSTFANQAVVAIQNARLFADVNRLAEELEQRVVERTAELAREQRNTETLLRILSEVSASLDLERALNRTLGLLNEAIGAEQGTVMLLHPEDNLLHYRAGYGYLTPNPSSDQSGERGFALKVGEGLAGWVVKNRQPALVPDLLEDPRWISSPDAPVEHRSALVTPLVVGEDIIGALLVFHRQPGFFSNEQLSLVQAIASQVAVAINNATLYELIRDQAERLGSMFRKEQIEASRQQAILEAVADGVLVTDANNRISFLNASARRILGLDSAGTMGQSLDAFVGVFGRAAQAWMETIHAWADEPGSYQVGESYAEQLNLEDGRVILVHLAPVIMRGNEFLGTVSIFRDITHEVEVDRLKSEFVATVSHELRTPMTSIRGYVDILLMGAAGALTESQVHFLDIIKGNTERLNILVNDLLDISRIEAGRITLSPQPLDLSEITEGVLAEMRRRSEEENKPMQFVTELPRKLPRAYGDAERVRQILTNLVDNAYHYTPENGQVTVRIHAEDGSNIQVDVQDTGVGIPPQDQERVFERFFRGENPLVLATPGTGLGLPIVRQLVNMHRGKIWMTSKGIPGEGSTFSFTLPVYQAEEEEAMRKQ